MTAIGPGARLGPYEIVAPIGAGPLDSRLANMLTPGTRLGPYEVVGSLGAGGPASVRALDVERELWRGLAEAQPRTRL